MTTMDSHAADGSVERLTDGIGSLAAADALAAAPGHELSLGVILG